MLVIGSDIVGNAVLLSRIHHMILPLPYHVVLHTKRQERARPYRVNAV